MEKEKLNRSEANTRARLKELYEIADSLHDAQVNTFKQHAHEVDELEHRLFLLEEDQDNASDLRKHYKGSALAVVMVLCVGFLWSVPLAFVMGLDAWAAWYLVSYLVVLAAVFFIYTELAKQPTPKRPKAGLQQLTQAEKV